MRPEILYQLFAPVIRLNGIGPRTGALIEKLAGPNIVDLLWHLPSGLLTRERVDHLSADYLERQIVIRVTVEQHFPSRNRRAPYRISTRAGGDALTLTYFKGREQYLRQQLPEGFQRAEYLMEHGMVDMVIPRQQLRPTIARLLRILLHKSPDPLDAGTADEAAVAADGEQGGETAKELIEADPAR